MTVSSLLLPAHLPSTHLEGALEEHEEVGERLALRGKRV